MLAFITKNNSNIEQSVNKGQEFQVLPWNSEKAIWETDIAQIIQFTLGISNILISCNYA